MKTNALLLSVSLSLGSMLAAQSKDNVISTTTEIVTVPVVVTDSSGKAIRGLKLEDFQVKENGKEQKIANFEEVTASRAAIPGSREQNGIYTNHLDNNPVALGILVIDLVNTRTVSQAWALRGSLSFLEKWKGKGGFQQPIMVAAITSQGLRIIHQATTKPEVLETALQMISPVGTTADKTAPETTALPNPPRDGSGKPMVSPRRPNESDADYSDRVKEANREAQTFDQMERSNEISRQVMIDADTKTTMWALMALANGVAGIPGRKALMWCSEAFPFKSAEAALQSPQWVAQHGSTEEDASLKPLREATLLALNRANISVYPVNAAGLSPAGFDAGEHSQMIASQYSAKMVRTIEGDMDNRANASIVADQTAGTTCMNVRDIGDCIDRTLDDASHYYMLAYYPDPKPNGNGYRRIKVEVKGEKVKVRARDSYWHGMVPTYGNSAKSELAVSLASNLDYTALPILLKFIGLKPGSGGKRIVEFVVGVDGRIPGIDEEHGNRVNLFIGALAKAGDNPTLISIDTKLKSELVPQIRAKQLTHNGEMEVMPGKYDLRLVVRDNLTGRIGSIVAPIEVQ